MQRAASSVKLLSISLFMVSLISVLPSIGRGVVKGGAMPKPLISIARQNHTLPRPVSAAHAFINYKAAGTVGCREAGEEEARALRGRATVSLKVLSLRIVRFAPRVFPIRARGCKLFCEGRPS